MEENKMPTVIFYAGKERCDILYYLVKMFVNVNKHVLVVDNSNIHDFYKLFSDDGNENTVRKNHIVVAKDSLVTEDTLLSEAAQEFDYVIIYAGLRIQEFFVEPNLIIAAPGFEPFELAETRDILTNMGREAETILMVRDKADNKFSDKVIIDWLNLNNKVLAYSDTFDQVGYASYIALAHNKDVDKISIKRNASPDTFSFLIDMGKRFLCLKEKELKKLLA